MMIYFGSENDKNIRPLLPGDVVEPLLYVMLDMESNDDLQAMAVESIVITEDTVFEDIDLGDGMFVFIFEMIDNNNNSYLSEAVIFEVIDGDIYLS